MFLSSPPTSTRVRPERGKVGARQDRYRVFFRWWRPGRMIRGHGDRRAQRRGGRRSEGGAWRACDRVSETWVRRGIGQQRGDAGERRVRFGVEDVDGPAQQGARGGLPVVFGLSLPSDRRECRQWVETARGATPGGQGRARRNLMPLRTRAVRLSLDNSCQRGPPSFDEVGRMASRGKWRCAR